MDYDKRRKEIDELVEETRLELVKDALKLQELQEINDQLQEMLEADSEDGKLYSFSLRFNSLGEALEYIDAYKDNLPTNKFTLDLSSNKTILEFKYKASAGR